MNYLKNINNNNNDNININLYGKYQELILMFANLKPFIEII